MDPNRFDSLTRSLSTLGSRRRALAATLGSVVGTLGVTRTAAKKKKKSCLPCKKRKKGKCKGSLPDGTACAGGQCQGGSCVAAVIQPPPGPPTCSDGIKNGSETGVDCGGPTCPRCPNGQGCVSRDDCQSAMCNLQINICQACMTSGDCGEDANGNCHCYPTVQGPRVCGKGGMPDLVTSCTLCPAPKFCWQPQPSEIFCVWQCGT